MLATLASLRVSRSSVEMCSNDELQDGRFGPVLKAKIGLPGLHNTSTVAVKVLRSTENWNQRLDVLDVRLYVDTSPALCFLAYAFSPGMDPRA